MLKGLGRAVHRHLAADERFGLRFGAGLVGALVTAVTFALLLLLVRAGWAPLHGLDTGDREMFNRIDTAHPELVRAAEVVSDVVDPNVFRVALTVIALVYLIHGERHHATRLVVTVFGGAALGLALKEIVGLARPVLPTGDDLDAQLRPLVERACPALIAIHGVGYEALPRPRGLQGPLPGKTPPIPNFQRRLDDLKSIGTVHWIEV